VPFALGFMLGDLSEGGKAAEPNALDPSSGLGDCGEQSIAPFGTHRRFCGGRRWARTDVELSFLRR
jgi:hypothetical protein